MTFKEIIANLESQVKDREYSADGDPESQLAKDAQVLRLVVQMLKGNKGLDRSRWEGCQYCYCSLGSSYPVEPCGNGDMGARAELERRIGGNDGATD